MLRRGEQEGLKKSCRKAWIEKYLVSVSSLSIDAWTWSTPWHVSYPHWRANVLGLSVERSVKQLEDPEYIRRVWGNFIKTNQSQCKAQVVHHRVRKYLRPELLPMKVLQRNLTGSVDATRRFRSDHISLLPWGKHEHVMAYYDWPCVPGLLDRGVLIQWFIAVLWYRPFEPG